MTDDAKSQAAWQDVANALADWINNQPSAFGPDGDPTIAPVYTAWTLLTHLILARAADAQQIAALRVQLDGANERAQIVLRHKHDWQDRALAAEAALAQAQEGVSLHFDRRCEAELRADEVETALTEVKAALAQKEQEIARLQERWEIAQQPPQP